MGCGLRGSWLARGVSEADRGCPQVEGQVVIGSVGTPQTWAQTPAPLPPPTHHGAFYAPCGSQWLWNWGGLRGGADGAGGSLGGLVSKLGCNLQKSPGVVGSGDHSPQGGWGGIREQRKGGACVTEHPAPLHVCPGKKTPCFQTHSSWQSPSVWGHL